MDLDLSFDLDDLNKNPVLWPKKIKVAFWILVFIGTFVANYFLFFSNIFLEVNSLKTKEEQLKKDYINKKSLVINLPEYKKHYEHLVSSFGEMMSRLPQEVEIASLLKNLNSIGVANNMTFQMFKPEKTVKHQFYIEHPVSVKMTGSYNDFGNFLEEVAEQKKLIVIDSLIIKKAGTAAGSQGIGRRSQDSEDEKGRIDHSSHLSFFFKANIFSVRKDAVKKENSDLSMLPKELLTN